MTAGWGDRDPASSGDGDGPAADPYNFDRRCRIESAFGRIGDAWGLTLEEFAGRLAWLEERDAGRTQGQLAVLHRQMRQWSRGRR